jgi:hypothetical protein
MSERSSKLGEHRIDQRYLSLGVGDQIHRVALRVEARRRVVAVALKRRSVETSGAKQKFRIFVAVVSVRRVCGQVVGDVRTR